MMGVEKGYHLYSWTETDGTEHEKFTSSEYGFPDGCGLENVPWTDSYRQLKEELARGRKKNKVIISRLKVTGGLEEIEA